MMQAPLPRTWWVRDKLLLAGGFPGDLDERATVDRLRRLLETGVRCFVSLQQPGEMSFSGLFANYAPVAAKLAKEQNISIACHNFPIVDMGVPSEALMREILDTIEAAIRAEQCVYVHCWGGHGRTGTVVGCWLREHGFSGEEALRRIQHLRRHDPWLMEWDAPQTDAQCNMILNWKPCNIRSS